jgi:hypothetical protein
MPAHSDDLVALRSIPAVLAFVAQKARDDGEDEADNVEAVLKAANVTGPDLRKARRVLARLGYSAVSDRLGELAGKAKRAKPAAPSFKTRWAR